MIEVIERVGNDVLWRYQGLDGVSLLWRGRARCNSPGQVGDVVAFNAELCDTGITLTPDVREQVKLFVNGWLEESGEGKKWLEGIE